MVSPKNSSRSLLIALTMIGTIVMSCLYSVSQHESQTDRVTVIIYDAPFEHLADVGEVHLEAVLVLVYLLIHVVEFSGFPELFDNWHNMSAMPSLVQTL